MATGGSALIIHPLLLPAFGSGRCPEGGGPEGRGGGRGLGLEQGGAASRLSGPLSALVFGCVRFKHWWDECGE